jgi:MoaA/NifB/PqqE/SkfB family radical SAM enzyme
MYPFEDIKIVHLELTTKCNVACPMCLRTVCGGKVNPQLPLVELSLSDIQTIFPKDWVAQLHRIYMCGNYGDPVVAQDTLAIFKYFREANPDVSLGMFTNGSARAVNWWVDMASVVTNVQFAIDGLADTNHLYRRGTNFETIMRNAKAFIGAGGKANWDFIVFKHNEHQVEEARQLAKDMGFAKFNVKKTGRFFSNTKSEVKAQQEVLSPSGEVEYYLEMPENPKYLNSALGKEEELVKKYGHIEKYLEATEIDCKVAAEKSIYVSAEGLIFPCCWTANQMYPWYFEPKSSQVWKLLNQLPEKEKSISALKIGAKEIVEGEFFKKISASWSLPSVKAGKLKTCAKTCGKEFDPFRAQFRV